MAETTGIQWADGTANFWIGCTKLSPACDGCYAEAEWGEGGRHARVTWGPHGDRSHVKAGAQVIRKHQRGAAAFIAQHGRKPRIFVNSLSDFADNHKSIDPAWREEVWQLARECPDVILMILTKRPQNLPGYLPADWGAGYPNVWIGTTVENQVEADRRREHLRAIPAIVHFVSYEPALGPVDWQGWEFIRWMISGGESGPNARPPHVDWFRDTRDWCVTHGITYLHKQWGEYCPATHTLIPTPREKQAWVHSDTGKIIRIKREADFHSMEREEAKEGRLLYSLMLNVGKKRADRLLDGIEHNGVPG